MKKLITLFIFDVVFGSLAAYFLFYNVIKIKPDKLLIPEVESQFNIVFPELIPKTQPLSEAVESAMVGTKGTYGIAIKNLKTNESYYFNEHQSFDSASLYKTWVLATAIKQIEEGKLKEDQVLSATIPELNEKYKIGTDAAELTEGEISLTVNQAMKQMITISHNYAALLLGAKIRLANVKTFLKENELKESFVGEPPKTTAYDMALYFEKLYKGELANPLGTQKMLDLFKAQQLNNGLPKYLPKDIKVGHKTGELGQVKHNAGIVFTEKGDYIIVVMSKSTSPLGAQERIAQLSKVVFDYFQKK